MQGVTLCVFLLMNSRNRLVNLLAAFFGVFLFACNAQKDTFRILNRLGVSSAHSTVYDRLRDLAKSAASAVTEMGQNPATKPFLVVYDNINKYRPAWRQTVAKEAQLKSGTAATAIMMEDVPPDAFNLKNIEAKKAEKGRSNLTVDVLLEDIDHTHLKRVSVGLVMRTAVSYIAGLSDLSKVLEDRFKRHSDDPDSVGYAKDRLRTRTSKIVPMGCSGISEASSSGNSDVLDDLFSTQLKVPDSVFKDLAFLVCGDQMTIDRLRKLIAYVEDEQTAFSQRRWVIPLIQLWHMKWAFLKAIYGTHYSDKSPGKHPHGLRAHLETIRRKINAKKCDFYPSHSGLKTVFESLVLTALLYSFPQRPDGLRELNPLELLVWFFSNDGPLHECTIESLDALAVNVYDRWMTTDAYSNALDPATAPLSMDSNNDGDHVLANSILLMRDTAWYLEFCAAVAEGDIGRVLEIIKVLRFYFWGSGSTNYGAEVLELACGFLYDFPEPLKQAISHNWLVNASGLEGHWHELDLLQEHHNLWIKRIFNSSNSEFDSTFLRELVSLNVVGFGWARKAVVSMLGLRPTSSGNPDINFSADITALAQTILAEGSLAHVASRSAETGSVNDNYAQGIDCLTDGQLATFISRSLNNEWDTDAQPVEGDDVGPIEGENAEADDDDVLPDPLTLLGGRLGIAEFEILGGLGDL
ncbi:hypothetical protein BDV93DRAFT_450359 [Ceratobasidium sp. AG-I]|nr:hypothetical protein BDV93DRAFT_450359 [Ceratobasidium sp. AG-I]